MSVKIKSSRKKFKLITFVSDYRLRLHRKNNNFLIIKKTKTTMGNQTLVPSQIQSVESYFLDLKSYIQFRASLGSTTFMKTAKVNLIENAAASTATYNDEYLVETRNMMIENHHHHHHHHHQSNMMMPASSANLNATIAMTANASQASSSTSSSTAAVAVAAAAGSQQTQAMNSPQTSSNANIQRLNQQQMIRQRLQALRDSQQQVVVKIFPK